MIIFVFFSFLLYGQYSNPINLQSINSSEDDLGLVYNTSTNKYYFHSNRQGSFKFFSFNDIESDNAISLNNAINNSNKNVSYISFDKDNNAIFSKFNNYKRQSYLNLFQSNYYKQSWGKGKSIEGLIGSFFISQSTISKDNNFIIFISDMDSELGDTDLYIAYRNDLNEWEKPIPLSELNSTGNEITPSLIGNDTLFFASNGQGGTGGYDIFMSKRVLGKWQRPVPMNELNSIYDDSDPFAVTTDTIYFSSNRVGGKGKYDFYYVFKDIENKKEENLEDFDIFLSSFVSNINVKTQSKIKQKAIYPYIHYDKNEIDFHNSFEKRNIETLKAVADYIRKGNNIELNIWTKSELEKDNEKNSKFIFDNRVDEILNYLKSNYKIDKSKINVNYTYSKVEKNYIYLFSKSDFLETMVEYDKSVKIEPSNFVFQLDIKQKEKVDKFELEMSINGKIKKQLSIGSQLPINSKIELDNFSKEISGSDSLNIHLTIFSNNQILKKDYNYSVTNSYEKIKEDDEQYLSFYLITTSDILNDSFYSQIIKRIESKFSKKYLIFESSYQIDDLIYKIENTSGLKITHKMNDNLGKEILVKLK